MFSVCKLRMINFINRKTTKNSIWEDKAAPPYMPNLILSSFWIGGKAGVAMRIKLAVMGKERLCETTKQKKKNQQKKPGYKQ